MAPIDQLLQLFARSIFAKARALACLNLSKRQRARLRRSITDDIRTCGGLLFPDVISPEVSRAAQQEAERLNPPVSLHDQGWYDQSRFDRGRKIFRWEHVYPVREIQKKCEQASSEEATLAILKAHLRIAWILKREDKELNRLGFRSNRPDPESAYRAAKIELLKLQSGALGASQGPKI
jgi:hypothetical protein